MLEKGLVNELSPRRRVMDVERHDGKVVIVTGAGNGIGRATAFRFALEGAKVFACDVNEVAIEESRPHRANDW